MKTGMKERRNAENVPIYVLDERGIFFFPNFIPNKAEKTSPFAVINIADAIIFGWIVK